MTTVGKYVAATIRLGLITVVLAGSASLTRSEVSAVVDPDAGSKGSIYLGVIVDGPDPINGIWLRVGVYPTRKVLNESGAQRGDGPPTVLGTPGGVCAVAWAKRNPGGYDVVLSRFVDGAWQAEETLANSAIDELDPVFVTLPDGSVRLIYWEAGPVPRILARTASPDLSAWTAAEVVSEPGVQSARPAAVIHDGALWIVYEVHQAGSDTAPRQVVAARFTGTGWQREVLAVSWAEQPLHPEIHSRSGQLWIDWIDAPGQVLWLRRELPGSWTTIGNVPYTTELERDYFARGTVRVLAVEQ